VVEACDHEAGEWVEVAAAEPPDAVSPETLLQAAIDAGYDDVRMTVHVTGCVDPDGDAAVGPWGVGGA